MNTHQSSIFSGLLLTALAAGCGSSTPSTDPAIADSQARLVLSARGSHDVDLKVTAIDEQSAQIRLTRSVSLAAGAVTTLSIDLPPSSYTFHVEAFADASETTSLGSGDARAVLAAGEATEIKLAAQVEESGGDGSATIEASADIAPTIDGVDVTFGGSGALGASADATALVQVKAHDPDGDALVYLWSGYGIEGVVQGGSSILIHGGAAIDGDAKVYVVVQDAQGATTTTAVVLSASGGFSIDAGGSASSGEDGDGEDDVSTHACVDASAACNAACDAALAASPLDLTAHASCLTQCGVTLSSCLGD
ncbi:MAG: hypothetical protein U0359_19885 [Byssovorax sp.]